MPAPNVPQDRMNISQCQDMLLRQERHAEIATQDYYEAVQELAREREEAQAAQETYLLCRGRYHRASHRIVEYEDRIRALQDEIVEEQEAVQED